MEKITLELTIDEANIILGSLGQQPYVRVSDLIQKIQAQGVLQLKHNKTADLMGSQTNLKEIEATKNGK